MGIPARPVTTYDSAHDTEANRTIDYYFDINCNMLSDKSSDSIWYGNHIKVKLSVYTFKYSSQPYIHSYVSLFKIDFENYTEARNLWTIS